VGVSAENYMHGIVVEDLGFSHPKTYSWQRQTVRVKTIDFYVPEIPNWVPPDVEAFPVPPLEYTIRVGDTITIYWKAYCLVEYSFQINNGPRVCLPLQP
jgi:hypothetical protein